MFKYELSVFIFRRDLRLDDNTGLIAALQDSKQVIPCFILDPRQVENNAYKSAASIQFMLESLEDLNQQLQKHSTYLYLFYGISEEIIEKIILAKKIQAVYFNRDYTPFSRKRDQQIVEACAQHQVDTHQFHDVLLNSPISVLKSDGTPYRVFTPYYQHAKKFPIPQPKKNSYKNYYKSPIKFTETAAIFHRILPAWQLELAAEGGREPCLKKLRELKNLVNYGKNRDSLSAQATSGLSPYLKFTTCSVREIYYAIKNHLPAPEAMIRELYWRDFFSMIGFYFPHVFGHSFQKKYDSLLWNNDKNLFTKWCQGETGFPVVDAGMRQLNQTGYMHNRARLITASFLTKDLHIDWRWGEKYFAKKLIDYDPAVNNGNWQWVASTGTDAQPYFRIFNPWLQQKKFDPIAEYIKQWVPELRHLDSKIIHQWYKEKYRDLKVKYPAPIVDHATEAATAKARQK